MTVFLSPLPQPKSAASWQAWGGNLIAALNLYFKQFVNAIAMRPAAVSSDKLSPTAGIVNLTAGLISGAVTVKTKFVTSTCLILLTAQDAPLGSIYEDKASRIVGGSFVIKSTDEREALPVAWFLIEPL